MEELEGSIESIVFKEEEKGFTVARLHALSQPGSLITIFGYLPGIQSGESIFCQGTWKLHPVYGKQLEVEKFEIRVPSTLLGIEKYLSSGLVKGIGPTYAKRIVKAFGMDTLTTIDKTPNRLFEIEGIGKKRAKQIINCWQEQKSIRSVMVFLRSYGVSPAYAQKIYKTYGDESIQKVKQNPYALAQDIFGIGFKMADKIAHELGIKTDSPFRLEAALEYLLSSFAEEGHTCYPLDKLLEKGEEVLDVPASKISLSLDTLAQKERVIKNDPFVWLKSFFMAEKSINIELKRLHAHLSPLRPIQTEKAIEWVQNLLHIKLAPCQVEAVLAAIENKVHIITGGPGTGKSTITKAILRIVEKLTDKILLAAPTGRAAKRMNEITHKKAVTIHSLLEFSFEMKGFKRNSQNPLDCSLIIVDEVSMIDTVLMHHLLKAIPSHAKLLLIGDTDQLPSVGPGTVLKDLLATEGISRTTLTELFRQGKHSTIAYNAKRINEGLFPFFPKEGKKDFLLIECDTPDEIAESVLKQASFYESAEDFQVLSPMRKGIIGSDHLNTLLQMQCNPSQTPLYSMGKTYHVNDKVMQIRNNYSKLVFNGDIGKITLIDLEESALIIDYDGRKVIYDFSELDEISLAYAVSIHKYQGSECARIVIPVHKSHFKLLTRNLIYTGITRAKKEVILIGSKQALFMAIQNEEVKERFTGLKDALK